VRTASRFNPLRGRWRAPRIHSEIIGAIVGADVIKNEITTHARAAIHLHPDVRTILEIGGQDSKITLVKDGMLVDFSMNRTS
jgi:activator of 2-hydroxyglutaryl-CoA dehydratase